MPTATGARARRDGRLICLVSAGILLAIVLLLLHDTAWQIGVTWYSSNAYNHGFLILPIVIYLAWRKGPELAQLPIIPDLRGLLAVGLSGLAWLMGHITGTLLVQEFALVGILQAMIYSIVGWPIFRALVFPIFYLYLAVPFGDSIEPRLQAITASLAVDLLHISGVPVFSDGNLISIPTGNFEVAEACSGLRFLIASMAMGVLFAGLMYRSWTRRILFLVICFVGPILANGVRAFGIIYLAYSTNNTLALGVDHIVYGWIFFSLITLLILMVGSTFRDPVSATSDPRRLPSLAGRSVPFRRFATAGALALCILLTARVSAAYLERQPATTFVGLHAPAVSGRWRSDPTAQDPLPPDYAAPDAQLSNTYEDGASRVHLHIGYYIFSRRGAQAVSSAQDFTGPRVWVPVGFGSTEAEVDGQPISVRFVRSVRGQEGHIVWYWYWVDGRFTGDPYAGKLLDLKAMLPGQQRASAIIAVSAGYRENPAQAENALRRFLGEVRGFSAALSAASRE